VPPFNGGARSAFAIRARRGDALDANDYASTLGLSFAYVPSMRNGAALSEDRGNAVVSTEPLARVRAIELPLERQRRVSIETSIEVRTGGAVRYLQLIDVHLEPLSSPSTLWLFRNPRLRQLDALLRGRGTPSGVRTGETAAGFVLGGDFNLIQGGADEPVYSLARLWSRDLDGEDSRATHRMGRLDYLFFRSVGGRGETLSTTRIDDRFGSDHHPVMGRFRVP
jgi:endonuclease/exonuclease/phosphatase family metal-dependent hydrolase